MDHSSLLDRGMRFVLVARASLVAWQDKEKHDWFGWFCFVPYDFVLHSVPLGSESHRSDVQLPKLRTRCSTKISPDGSVVSRVLHQRALDNDNDCRHSWNAALRRRPSDAYRTCAHQAAPCPDVVPVAR